ncbi:MAG TPA: class I SAM-dependent methyltransferase [Acidobacteriaceae bacterium]
MDSIQTAIAKARWSLHHRGVIGTLKAAASRLASNGNPSPQQFVHPFDAQYGVDTSGLITAVHLTTGHAHDLLGTGYCGVAPSRFNHVIQRWIASPPEHPIATYSFIDIGCGKGRAMMLASAQPFAEIIGVELHPGLAQTAAANLEKWRATQHPVSPTRVVSQDATVFEFPDTPCLLYLYNPFAEPILQLFLDHIERSFSTDPRALDILYCNPRTDRLLAQHPCFRQIWSESVPVAEEDIATNPSAGSNEPCSLYRRVTH